MILGFAHLTYISQTGINKEYISNSKAIINEQFLRNPKEKLLFMKQATLFHHLKIVPTPLKVEFINYGSTQKKGQGRYKIIDKMKNSVELKVIRKHLGSELDFWVNIIGFRDLGKNKLHFSRPIPGMSVELNLKPTFSLEDTYIDSPGFSVIAFIVRGVEELFIKLSKLEHIETTKLFRLEIGSNVIRGLIAKTPSGSYCEFYEVITHE